MKTRRVICLISLLCLMLGVTITGLAQGKNTKDSASHANKAATVLKEIMGAPDKAIPKMEGVYGKDVTAREVLKENKVKAPAVVQVFPRTLTKYSPRKARR